MKNDTQLKELHLWTDGECGRVEPISMQRFLRSIGKDAHILDIGCGDGRGLRLLNDKGYFAKGVDLNPELVELCNARGLTVELGDACEVVRRDLQLYSVFSMLDFVEHIPLETLLELLRAIAGKRGARVWIQTPNLDSIIGQKFWFHMPTHILPLHPWVLRKVLDRLGFKILDEWTDYGGLPWTGFRRWLTIKFLNAVFGAPMAQLFLGGGNICIVAESRGPEGVANASIPTP